MARRIVSRPDIMFGKPCFEGTRIPVDLVIELVAAGQPMETILEGYPRLTVEDVQAALRYAAESVRMEIAHPSVGQ